VSPLVSNNQTFKSTSLLKAEAMAYGMPVYFHANCCFWRWCGGYKKGL